MEGLLLIGLYIVGAPIALGAWALSQSRRIEALSQRVEALARTIAESQRTFSSLIPASAPAGADEVVSETPRPDGEPATETEVEGSAPGSPLAGVEPTTFSDASVVEQAPAPAVAALAPDEAPSKPDFHRDTDEPEGSRDRERRPAFADFSLELWLSERGVAWVGGGALALGGVLLIAVAVREGFFTPLMRLAAALVVGALLIGASEWVRNTGREGRTNHPLVAALLAGAGAGVLYAACWGAYGLYNYIPWSFAAAGLAACSAVLLGLALLHGEALGVLAIVAALLAPLLTGKGVWPAGALTLYLVIAASAGFAIAAFRRWVWASAAAMLASYAWFAVSLADGSTIRSLVLVCLAAAGGSALALRPPPKRPEPDEVVDVHTALPSVAVALSSALLVVHWANDPQPAGATLASLAILALAAMAVRAGRIGPAALVISLVAIPACYVVYALPVRLGDARPDLQGWYAWALLSAGGAGLAGLAAALRAKEEHRALLAGAGALSALAVLVVAALTDGDFSALTVWAPLAVGALLLFAGAYVLSTRAEDVSADAAVDWWAGAGAAAMLLAIESAVATEWRPLADAAAAFLFAALHARSAWRIAQTAAAVAAAACLAHAFSPSFAGRTLAGELNTWFAVVVLTASAASMFAASRFLRRRARVDGFVDSLSSAAILAIVLSAFLLLRWFASGGAGGRLDSFTEMSLQALALIVAGFVAIPRRGQSSGVIARVRGHVLMGAGLVFDATNQGLLSHPWWGAFPALVSGPPILNANALAFAAPAALAFLVAGRFYGRARIVARVYLGAGAILGFSWIASEIRRAFHGEAMAQGPIGLAEGSAYGLAALLVALAVAIFARVRAGPDPGERPFTEDLVQASKGLAMAAIVVAAVFLCLARNAWWGGQAGQLTQAAETALATASHAIAAIICVLLARAQLMESDRTRRFACGAAAFFALTFGVLTIRWIHHGGAMDNDAALSGLEAFGYALWPMALAAVGAKLCERIADHPAWSLTARSMGAVLSVAIWPALTFLALGLWLLYCPWWGAWPVDTRAWLGAALALSAYLAAAALSLWSARLVILWENATYAACAKAAAVAHLFVAATLVVRCIYAGPAMNAGAPGDVEIWTYSAVWALFGAVVVALGALKRDSILRWSGLTILFATAAKVFLIDMRDLEGVIRAGSFLALGAVLVMVALAARRFGRSQESRSA